MMNIKDNKNKELIEAILEEFFMDDCQNMEEVFTKALGRWRGYSKSNQKLLAEALSLLFMDKENICKVMNDWSERNYQIAEMLGYGDPEEDYEDEEDDPDYEDDGVCDCDCEHCVTGCICE